MPYCNETVSQPGCVHSQKNFQNKGSDLGYISEISNITPLEDETVSKQRKFHISLFDLAGETAMGVVFHSLSA